MSVSRPNTRRDRGPTAIVLQTLLGTSLVAASLLLLADPAQAVGSAQFNTQQQLIDGTTMYADILATGETINVSMSGSTTVTVYDTQGTRTTTDDGPALDVGVVNNLTAADPMTAPLPNPYRYTPAQPGTYRIELDALVGSTIGRFDITVTDNATIDPDPTRPTGRIFSYEWDLFSRNGGPPCGVFCESVATDVNLFALTPGHRADGSDNYVWQLDLGTFAGGGYALAANSLGLDPPFSGISAAQADSNPTPEHPLYLGYPERAGPRPTQAPVVSAARFLDDSGVGADATFSPGNDGIQDTGTFEFTTDISGGNYAISIDIDRGGVFGDPGDVLLIGAASRGQNAVSWDGNDAFGTPVPLGTYHARIDVRGGEFHFIAEDVETSGGTNDTAAPRTYAPGLTIFSARAFGDFIQLTPTDVFWDDLSAGFSGDSAFDATANTPTGERSGSRANPVDSDGDGKPDGFHTWGAFAGNSFGDGRNIDTYAYGLVGQSVTTFRASADNLPDADADGLSDSIEGDDTVDTDGDGLPDRRDFDADGDGLPDNLEGTADGDADGVPDFRDLDSDNDGIPDLVEAGGSDLDGDGKVDNAVDTEGGGNGWDDRIEADNLADPDSDRDGIPDRRDLDSDNDGLPDRSESGYPRQPFDPTDPDNPAGPLNSDGTEGPDYLDLDSDDDGIPDLIEGGGTDPDNSGRVSGFVDVNRDGLDDRLAANPLPDPDTNADGIPDRIQSDADGDGIADGVEAGYPAPFEPGNPDNPSAPADDDGNGIPNHLQDDRTPVPTPTPTPTPTATATTTPTPPPSPSPPPEQPPAVRIARPGGSTPIEQAIAVVSGAYDQAETVVLGRDDVYADSLSGGPLAAALHAPLLLTDRDTLVQPLSDELERLGATAAVLLGGESAISSDVAQALLAAGVDVRRVGGRNRFETSLLVAGALGPNHEDVFVVEGENTDPQRGWPDAMAISAYAASTGRPILLVNRDRLPEESARGLQRHNVERAVVVGGVAAVSGDTVEALENLVDVRRIAGATRFETSLEVLRESLAEGVDASLVYVTTGLDWRNTLTAGPLAGDLGGNIAIIDGQGGQDTIEEVVQLIADQVTDVVVVGDEAVITDDRIAELRRLLIAAGVNVAG